MLPTLEQIKTTSPLVYAAIPATPQYSWSLLNEKLGCEIWLKH